MFNTSNGYSLSDIAAVSGANRGYDDEGFGGNGAWWIIILFLFVFCGWGNNGWGGQGNNVGTQSALTRGDLCSEFNFNDLQGGVRGLEQGICSLGYDQLAQMNGINSNIAAGFAGVNSAICTLGYQNADLINGVNVALMQGQNALSTQLADCCCKTQSGMKDIAYQMATDTCAITTAAANNTRDIIDSQNAGTRAILDAITQDRVDALRDKVEALRERNTQLAFEASQAAQTNALVGQLRPCPVPAYVTCNPWGTQVPYGSCASI